MTQNQIEYFKAGETARHQRETEREQNRYNTLYLNELQRSNVAREIETKRYNDLSLAEQRRANLARETQNLLDLQERSRSNRVNESISRDVADNNYILGTSNLFETSRRNTSEIGVNAARREYTRAQTTNVGADTAVKLATIPKIRSEVALIGAKTKTENTMRQPQRTKIVSDTFGLGVSHALDSLSKSGKLIKLFGGI